MKTYKFDLSELVKPPFTDSISGRPYGEGYALSNQFLDKIKSNAKVEIIIDDEKVKYINDSFIKGLFNEVFKELKTTENVKKQVTLIANNNFTNLFEKNWSILESIYNV